MNVERSAHGDKKIENKENGNDENRSHQSPGRLPNDDRNDAGKHHPAEPLTAINLSALTPEEREFLESDE